MRAATVGGAGWIGRARSTTETPHEVLAVNPGQGPGPHETPRADLTRKLSVESVESAPTIDPKSSSPRQPREPEGTVNGRVQAQHFLNFLPLPQGHGSFRPTFSSVFWIGSPPRTFPSRKYQTPSRRRNVARSRWCTSSPDSFTL